VTFFDPGAIIDVMTPRRLAAVAFVLALAGVACTKAVATAPAPPEVSVVASPVSNVADPAKAGPVPVLPSGTFVARARTPNIAIWKGPSTSAGRRLVFPTRNPLGQPLEFLVAKTARDADGEAWIRILLPIRPNGAAGWVKKSHVIVRQIRERIVVDLSARTLRYFRDGTLADRFDIGIGRPETPTALGTFYVWAQVPQASPTGPYGVFALGLSGFSEVIKNWPGGGRMAIHGTSNPGDRGQMVSHGCVRVFNDDMVALKQVPMGTPVVIRA
jgi:lipoprotein-anchoring transpeptidase ErfK/SrfK